MRTQARLMNGTIPWIVVGRAVAIYRHWDHGFSWIESKSATDGAPRGPTHRSCANEQRKTGR